MLSISALAILEFGIATNVFCIVLSRVVLRLISSVVQSDKVNIFVDATVDLKTERLNAEFNTVPQQGLGISLSNLINPYVKVSGTLASPALGLNPESALIEGGVAVATGGLSILALTFKDRFLSTRDPCGEAISDADERFRALEQKYGRSGSTAQE